MKHDPLFQLRVIYSKKNFWKKLWEFGVFIDVRNSIRKSLREGVNQGISKTPEWVIKFNNFSREERIDFIEKYKKQIERLLPKIIIFFENKLGDKLIDITVGEKETLYGNEMYSGTKIVLEFHFNDYPYWELLSLKHEIWNDLISFFNIDMGYYGVPLEFESK